MEHVEIDLQPRCDDGTLPESPTVEWYNHLKEATKISGKPVEYQQNTRHLLEAAGFTDIQERVVRAPFNTWPKDPHQKHIGRWYCVGLSDGIEALSMAPFVRTFNWPVATVNRFAADVAAAIRTRRYHAYNNM